MRRTALVVVALAVAVALGACGGGGDDDGGGSGGAGGSTTTSGDGGSTPTAPAEPPEFEEWVLAVDEICLGIRDDFRGLGNPQELDAVVATLTRATEIQREANAEIRAVGVPTLRSDEVEELLDAFDARADRIAELVAIARQGDQDVLAQAFFDAPEVDDAISTTAGNLGVLECVDLSEGLGADAAN